MSAGSEELERLLGTYAVAAVITVEAERSGDRDAYVCRKEELDDARRRIRALFAEGAEFAAKVALQSCAHCGVEYAQMAVESHMRCPGCRMAEREAQVAALASALERFVAVEDEPCRIDHDGFCQAHISGAPCRVAAASLVLGPAATVAREHDARVIERASAAVDRIIDRWNAHTVRYDLLRSDIRAALAKLSEPGGGA